jgi:antitoxin PrlF
LLNCGLSVIMGPRKEVMVMPAKGAAGTGMLVQLSSRGQVTLPSGVRRDLGLRPGDALVVAVQDGRVVLEPVEVLPLERYTDERIEEFRASAELSVEELEEARSIWSSAPPKR